MMAKPGPAIASIDHALAYIALGWCLCSIRPGTKGPTEENWNGPAQIVDSTEKALAIHAAKPTWGWGLVHGPSGTCAIDIDHLEYATLALAELGIDLAAEIQGAPQIIGRAGRGKAVFKLPAETKLNTHRLVWPPLPGGKPTVLIELRAGPVQDVLPPTIHPETLNPYAWADGIPSDVPAIPTLLLSLWTNWAAVVDQLRNACPWAPKEEKRAPLAKPRFAVSTEQSDIIGAFNRNNDTRAMLESLGYKSKGKRLLSPTSQSGLAGVTIMEDGRCYSHHASDPLNDGHAHDAFDLYVMFSHGNDFVQAVRTAAEMMQSVNIPDLPAFDHTAFIERSKAAKAPKAKASAPAPIPGELTRIPGALQSFVDHTLMSAIKPQRVLAITGALAFGAVMMARTYASLTGLRTNIYLIGVGETGSGKDNARKVIKEALKACAKQDRLGGEEFASGAGVFAAVARNPACVFQIDEFGAYLAQLTDKNAQGHKADIVRQLMIMRSSSGTTMLGPEYADQRLRPRVDIECPCAVLHGTTTPGELWPALKSGHLLSGMLNRFIVTHSENPNPERKEPQCLPNAIPAKLIEWGKAITTTEGRGTGNLQGISPSSPIIVGQTQGANRILHDFALETDAKAFALLNQGLNALWVRAAQMAVEIAMIVAGSINPKEPVIDDVAARWGVEFVRYWTERLVIDASSQIVDTEFMGRKAAVLRLIKKADTVDKAYSVRELSRQLRTFEAMRPNERKEVIESLKNDGDIFEFMRTPVRGPKTVVYIARAHAGDDMTGGE